MFVAQEGREEILRDSAKKKWPASYSSYPKVTSSEPQPCRVPILLRMAGTCDLLLIDSIWKS